MSEPHFRPLLVEKEDGTGSAERTGAQGTVRWVGVGPQGAPSGESAGSAVTSADSRQGDGQGDTCH